MKLSDYAKKAGVHYHTAYRWFKNGQIRGYQMETGTIIITENDEPRPRGQTVIYARVSSADQKNNLDRQVSRLADYCAAQGWQVGKVVKEVGSGINDNRRKFMALLADPDMTRIVVEHKDRATRFGFNYLETLLEMAGRELVALNLADTDKEDLLHDLTWVIYSFCARLYGQRRAKRKTEQITRELTADGL